MPFNTLMLDYLIPDTSFAESGGRVNVKPQLGETVLFFRIDDLLKRNKLKTEGKVCDMIVFYCKRNKKVLCLTELKGSDINHAIEQVINTYHSLRRGFKKTHLSQIEWKVYIHSHGSVPGKRKNKKKGKQTKRDDPHAPLKKIFNKNYQITHQPDMGKFLRNQT